MTIEEKLELLGYKVEYKTCILSNIIDVGYVKETKYISLYITMRSGQIVGGVINYFKDIEKQEQIDNLQIAYNILKSDLKELGYGR